MEVLLEYRGSRRQLGVASSETVLDVVARELRRVGRRQANVVTADTDLSQPREGKIFILQKWSTQWDCYVDVNDSSEVCDGDRLGVVAKPNPPTRLMRLCCCGCAASNEDKHRKAMSNMLNGVKKNEEIQSLDYKFNVESELSSHASEWESQSLKAVADQNDGVEVVDDYIRADSGRASWRLVPTKPLAHSQLDTGADCTSNSPTPSNSSQINNKAAIEGANAEAVNDSGAGETAEKKVEESSPQPCTDQALASSQEEGGGENVTKEEDGEAEKHGTEVNEKEENEGENGEGEDQTEGDGEIGDNEEMQEEMDKADS